MSWTCLLCFLRDDPPPQNTAVAGGATVLAAIQIGIPVNMQLCRVHGALVDQLAEETKLRRGSR